MSPIEHDEPAGLSTGAVARLLGVAPTTVRSWDQRYGLGPVSHTSGRHRRWTAMDIARLERMCALTMTGVPPAEAARIARDGAPPPREPAAAPKRPGPARGRSGIGLQLGDARRECKGLARAALRLDAPSLDGLLTAAIADHGLVTAWQEVIMPTLQAVGRKWESSGEKYVEVEHFLSWHVSSALRRSTPPVPAGQSADVTLLACVPGENHTLPLEALTAALAEHGLPVRMFGAAMPTQALLEAVRRTGPAAVGLWAQSRTTASRPLAQHVASMQWGVRGARRHPLVLTLGPGWAGQTVPGLPRPPGLAEALAVLRTAATDDTRRPVTQ
ncbi:transcriptional regulator [Streptomyces longisporoflavus]|uniref:MerR family transcriptional regulator n=1 Tax=Streptomyces longisporoflavus TaxID=28044 RepID=UPI00167C7BB7|nr:MerR family transcriptional regulator [Streptomyces longisporoflavus]GGV24518.1 transcriptional regulator [Streptomyces longisporoflavus]